MVNCQKPRQHNRTEDNSQLTADHKELDLPRGIVSEISKCQNPGHK